MAFIQTKVTQAEQDNLGGTTLIVNKIADTNDGTCDTDCSLREAIAASNNGDTINFSTLFNTPQTITLGGTQLSINTDVSINGPGENLLTVSGNNASRVFDIENATTVSLDGMTISNGNSGEGGGGIRNVEGTLTITNSTISNNTDFIGGGIFSLLATLTATNCTISNNSSPESGGGIALFQGTATITNSTISNNSVTFDGGGILNLDGTLTINNSAISDNLAQDGGGGIANSSTLTITNSTISNNSASLSGGGIENGGTVTISNSTISNNSAQDVGGGVHNEGGTVNSRNTIFANNTGSFGGPDFFGTLTSQGYNLIRNTFHTNIEGNTTGNITSVDPQLDPNGLQDNGGSTKTIALLANSPAIDAANPTNFPADDQRGFPRPFDGDSNGSALPDIGAFEFGSTSFNNSARFDLDGDGKTDIGIWRPDVGQWWYLRSIDDTARAVEFGQSSDVIVPADFTGDGATDIAFFRSSPGQWFVLRSEDNSFFAFDFGTNGDIPAPGDFDGDGKADAAIFRPANSTWFILKSSDSNVIIQQFGQNGDAPIVEDYDGDGKDDLAVYRPSESQWFYQRSTDLVVKGFEFGTPGDTTPVPADFTGDGKADIAFYKPSATGGANNWFILRSDDDSFYAFPFGLSTDIPVSGDYNGDGDAEAAVFRPTNNTWFLEEGQNGSSAIQFGIAGDKPIPSAYIP